MATCNDVRAKARGQGLTVKTGKVDARMIFEFFTSAGRSCGRQTGARQALRWLGERRAMLALDVAHTPA